MAAVIIATVAPCIHVTVFETSFKLAIFVAATRCWDLNRHIGNNYDQTFLSKQNEIFDMGKRCERSDNQPSAANIITELYADVELQQVDPSSLGDKFATAHSCVEF